MRFLVIGLGSIGMRHAKNLMAMGHEVVGKDPDETAMQNAKAVGVEPIENFFDRSINAVVIATPTPEHEIDLECAADIGRHIFVEKPIADEVTDHLLRGLTVAKKNNLIVMVGNMLRFHPNVMMAKSLIKNPKSALFQVLQKNDKPAYRRDGVLLNWGAHEIDLALYLLGPAEVIEAKVQEDFAAISLKHENGAHSRIIMDYLTEPEMREFEIEDKDSFVHEVNLTLHDWNPIYMAEMEAFVNMVKAATEKPDDELNESTVLELVRGTEAHKIAATGEDGLATLRLIEEAKEMAGLS